MFAANYMIDTVQNAKLSILRKVITDKDLQKLAEDHIKAESDFAKSIISSSFDLVQYSLGKINNPFFPKNNGANAPKQ